MVLGAVKNHLGHTLNFPNAVCQLPGLARGDVGDHHPGRAIGYKILVHHGEAPAGFRILRQIGGDVIFHLHPVHGKQAEYQRHHIQQEKQVLIISLGAKLKIGKCKAVRDWFLANEFADFGDPFTNFFMSRRLPKGFVEDKNVQQNVVEYFASFDEHIKDFRIEKVPQEAESKEERYQLFYMKAMHFREKQ